jgi:predicted metal-dependent phosphoesterase TrpH
VFTVDLHAHTRFFHGWRGESTAYDPVGARLLAGVGRARGLDGVALTNHDYYRPFDVHVDPPLFVPGIEISTTAGHVLVVGPDPPARTRPGTLPPRAAASLAHDRGCAAVIAHPYRNSTVREDPEPFDAVEVNGKHPRNADHVRALADDWGMPVVGGSDAHFPFEVGRAVTRVDADALTPESVVAAIRDGRVEPEIRRGPFHRALRHGYRHVHRVRRRLRRYAADD